MIRKGDKIAAIRRWFACNRIRRSMSWSDTFLISERGALDA
jgi:hypothetical protein